MLRTLPWSLLGHALIVAAMLLFGGQVTPPRADAGHAIRVRLGGPGRDARGGPAGPRLSTPAPAARPAPPKPEPGTRRAPAAEKKPERAKKPATPPAAVKGRAPDTRDAQVDPAAPAGAVGGRPGGTDSSLPAGGTGAAAGGTDQPFPFAWYLTLVEGQVSRNWNPTQLGFGAQAQRRCVVHFVILSDGTTTDARVQESSGVPLFDREAQRAVAAANPLPPLPRGFPSRSLGVSFVFTLRSAS